jgi:hypothetical protein
MADATSITAKEMISSVLQNLLSGENAEGGYAIRDTGNFASEFDTQLPEDSGESAIPFNLFACAYPTLFPYGLGTFSATTQNGISFITRVRWALRFHDGRFARHSSFPFICFGIWQKSQALSSAKIQINRRDFERDVGSLTSLTRERLDEAIKADANGHQVDDPLVAKLIKHVRSMSGRVIGSDQSRAKYRGQIYGTTITENPPNIWTTWNINDIDEPMFHVLAGEEITMDRFNATFGPNPTRRSELVAANPMLAAEVFHFMVNSLLQHLMGIDASGRTGIKRRKGILGEVHAYFGVIEAQGRGTLHLHMLMWLENGPTFHEMQDLLHSPEFREKVRNFIDINICAHLDPFTSDMINDISKEAHLAYSRPPDPYECSDFEKTFEDLERRIVRNQQLHTCTRNTCLKYDYRQRAEVCKRHAPWLLSDETVVHENGEWFPKRLHPYLNNWNSVLTVYGRMNHDIKWISNGQATKDAGFYMSKYSTKPQESTHNLVPLIAKGVETHRTRQAEDDTADLKRAHKLLLYRCFQSITRNMEYSGPQVMSYLLGYGDHIASHNYTPLHWTSVECVLELTFPELRTRSRQQ